MKKTSRAFVLTNPGEWDIREYPVLDPSEHGAVLKIECAGICGTDMHFYKGQVVGKPPYPVIPGHENVGIIAAKGKKLEKDFLGQPLKEGDRVAMAPSKPCFNCYICLGTKTPERCKSKLAYGFTSNPDHPPHLTGGYAEYMQAYRADSIFFKTNASAKSLVMLEPFSIAMNAVDKAQIKAGEVVAIQGSGPIGLLALLAAKRAGASKIIMVGAPQGRLDLAKKLGADVTISIEEMPDMNDRIEALRNETIYGLGADVVLECAGMPAAIAEGLEYVRDGGRYIEAGNFTDNGDVKINPFRHLCSKAINFYGAWASQPDHFMRCLRIIENDQKLFEGFISHIVPLDNVGAAFEAMAGRYNMDGRDMLKVVVAP